MDLIFYHTAKILKKSHPMHCEKKTEHTSIFNFLSKPDAGMEEQLTAVIETLGFDGILNEFRPFREGELLDRLSFTHLYDSSSQISSTTLANEPEFIKQLQLLLGYYELVARVQQTHLLFTPNSPENHYNILKSEALLRYRVLQWFFLFLNHYIYFLSGKCCIL